MRLRVLFSAQHASAHLPSKSAALATGNSIYQRAKPLSGPKEDVRVVAAALQAVGFRLSGGAALVDLNRAGLDRAFQQFGRDIADADVAFVYYAGHAVQFHGSSFLGPVDAAVSKEADLDSQTLHVGPQQQLESSSSRLNMLVLDACHSNPFEDHGLMGSSQAWRRSIRPRTRCVLCRAAGYGRARHV